MLVSVDGAAEEGDAIDVQGRCLRKGVKEKGEKKKWCREKKARRR